MQSTTVVYNFRIAQITKQPVATSQDLPKNNVLGLLFNQHQKKYIGTKQNFTGLLTSYSHSFEPYYLRVDFAFAHIKDKLNQETIFSGTETDDLLFTAGRNFITSPKNVVSLSGLFGIPTHKNNYLKHPGFGFNQVGFGAQLDGVYSFNNTTGFIWGSRYVYFAPGHALDRFENRYKYTVGHNVTLLISTKYDHNHRGFEFGYSPSFLFGGYTIPKIDILARNAALIRNSLYLVYKQHLLIKNIHNLFLCNISFSRDQRPFELGNKEIIMAWIAWNVSF